MDIKIKDIRFGYSSTQILNDICLDIDGPQFVSIVGPNGVGKSTLIHCINGILSPKEGTVMVDGKPVSEYELKELARKIGYVPYTSSDAFSMTVVDTVFLGRHPHTGWRTTEKDLDIVYDVLEKMGISDLAMRPFNELSAGQHQKVMLARGLAQKPEILLLDEPTSNLDIKHQIGISRMLRHLSHDEGMMVVMISHDLNIAAKYSDNILMMHDGRIYAAGTPEEVITVDNIRHVYGVDCRIIDDGGTPHIITIDNERDDCNALPFESTCIV